MAVTASAGDSGYGVNYPSASQYVTAVGGTTLTKDSSVPRGWDETVWGNGTEGTKGDGTGSSLKPMNAWVQINYGDGYSVVWGWPMNNGDQQTTPDFQDAGDLTQACFQFTWAGAAVHCTQGV